MLEEKIIDVLVNNNIDSVNYGMNDKGYGFGDIIYAKRYKNDRGKKKLPVGHRDGAYLVLDYVNGRYLVLYGTREFPVNKNVDDYFCLPKSASGLFDDYYFFFDRARLIDDYAIKGKMGNIPLKEGMYVINRVNGLVKKGRISKEIDKDIDKYPLIPGDVYKEENKYFLYLGDKDSRIYVLPLKNSGSNKVNYGSQERYFNYDELSFYDKKDSYHRVGYVIGEQLDSILKKIELLVNNSKTDDCSPVSYDKTFLKVKKASRYRLIRDKERRERYKYIGMLVKYKTNNREYIVISKDEDNLIMLDKEKYINGEYYLQVASINDVKVLYYLEKQSFLDVLTSLQDKYSSYYDNYYIYRLRRVIEE